MRLTLRTLLAYLDDILEPAHAREIGEKINESGYASSLVEHIREVMRKRRLGAPDASGPGIGLDPNSVAEYLDNTLTPEEVADIERICLESDLHLAEVAACHQILTIVLGEPVDVPERTRERMYVLGTSRRPETPEDDRSNGDGRQAVPSVTGSMPPDRRNGKQQEFEGVPEYLKPRPTWRRLGPVLAGAVILAVWLLMISSNPSLIRPDGNADISSAGELADASGAATPDSPDGIVNGILNEAQEPSGDAEENQVNASERPNGSLLATREGTPSVRDLNGFDPPPPPDAPEDTQPAVAETESAEEAGPTVPSSESVAAPMLNPAPSTVARPAEPTTVAAVSPARPVAPDPAEVVPAEVVVEDAAPGDAPQTLNVKPAPEMLYVSRDGVFLMKSPDGWRIMPRRSVVRTGDSLAAPEPFPTLLDVASIGLTIEVLGGTALEVVGASDEADLILRLKQGRMTFQNRGAQDPDDPAAVGILIGSEMFHLAFTADHSVCGIEMVPTEPNGFEQPPAEDQFVGNLFVERGAIRASVGKPGGRMLTAPAWLPLTVSVRRKMAAAGEEVPILPVPEWVDPDGERLSPAQRRYGSRFEKQLDPDVPVHLSVPAVVTSQVPDVATLAVKCLAVTELHEQLVEALARAEFTEAREAAARGIRQWLPRHPENMKLLPQMLKKNFPPDQVETVYRLLWGYSEADAGNPATSKILVDLLRHDSEVIRQLAYSHVYRLTGQRFDYRPNLPRDQRLAALKRWESFLEKNDGRLVP